MGSMFNGFLFTMPEQRGAGGISLKHPVCTELSTRRAAMNVMASAARKSPKAMSSLTDNVRKIKITGKKGRTDFAAAGCCWLLLVCCCAPMLQCSSLPSVAAATDRLLLFISDQHFPPISERCRVLCLRGVNDRVSLARGGSAKIWHRFLP